MGSGCACACEKKKKNPECAGSEETGISEQQTASKPSLAHPAVLALCHVQLWVTDPPLLAIQG